MLLLTLVPWPGPLEPRPACTREKAALVRKLVNKVGVSEVKKRRGKEESRKEEMRSMLCTRKVEDCKGSKAGQQGECQ